MKTKLPALLPNPVKRDNGGKYNTLKNHHHNNTITMGSSASKEAEEISVLSRDDNVHIMLENLFVMLEHDKKVAAKRGEAPTSNVYRIRRKLNASQSDLESFKLRKKTSRQSLKSGN